MFAASFSVPAKAATPRRFLIPTQCGAFFNHTEKDRFGKNSADTLELKISESLRVGSATTCFEGYIGRMLSS